MGDAIGGLVKVLTAIIVVAIIVVIVSKKSSSVQVIQSGSTAFASLLKEILSPIQQGTSAVSATTGSGAPYAFGG
jgi:hypothetical protein